MKDPVIIVGIGEMGGVFARGFLRSGHPVYPVTRQMDFAQATVRLPEPALTLVAVAELDLATVLERVPTPWRDRLGLLQNELLPRDWERHGIDDPTVISVWFEKKPGQDAKVLVPSPVYGPHAGLIEAALDSLSIPTRLLERREDMVFELVRKNIYILTTNVCGLEVGGTVGSLWQDHRELATAVANEVLELQSALCGMHFASQTMIDSVVEAFQADPEHKCMGRSAPQRLRRALEQADELGLAVKQLRTIEKKSSSAQA